MADEIILCDRCAHVHEKCKAHNRAGLPCGQSPMSGQRVCRLHGGANPQAINNAAKRAAERAAVIATQTFGLPVEVDPTEALLQELHRTAGAVQWLGAIVADLEQHTLVEGTAKETVGRERGEYTDIVETGPGINMWVQLWHKERAHLLAVSKACIAAGIEERRVQLAESQGLMLATVIKAVLHRLQLTPAQQTLVATVVPEEMRRLAS